jgi:tetratricopeptide (TPR) repeat protein
MTRSIALLLTAAGLAACPADRDRDAVPADTVPAARAQIAPEARVQLDSGNAAYREERFDEALRFYEAAVQLDSAASATWFGIYMAQTALGNTAAASAAIERARSLAPTGPTLERLPEEVPGVVPADSPGRRRP